MPTSDTSPPRNNPQFPVYIISKARWESRLTSRALEAMGVPYRVVVEEQEWKHYAAVIDPAKVLVLDKAYQRNYDAFCDIPEGQSSGITRRQRGTRVQWPVCVADHAS
jgi:hypothetical protein